MKSEMDLRCVDFAQGAVVGIRSRRNWRENLIVEESASEPSAGLGGSEGDAAIRPLWITERKPLRQPSPPAMGA